MSQIPTKLYVMIAIFATFGIDITPFQLSVMNLPDSFGNVDADHDGWDAELGDCDDNNDLVYPGAPEICDGLDNNCNNLTPISEGMDADGDGWLICEGDCDDNYPFASPGVPFDIFCNGIDDDCNGEVDDGWDEDGDGWTQCGPDGVYNTLFQKSLDDDCDDKNPNVHPCVWDVAFDGIDNNCNGLVDDPSLAFDFNGTRYYVAARQGEICKPLVP